MAEHDASERPDTVEDLWQDVSAVMETRPDACARCGQPAEMEMLQVDMSEFRGKLVAKARQWEGSSQGRGCDRPFAAVSLQVRCAACGYTAAEAKPSCKW